MGARQTLLVGLVVVTLVAPAAALGGVGTGGEAGTAEETATPTPSTNATGAIEVTVGDELATVIQAENSTVQAAVSGASFRARYANASGDERTDLLAARGERLERQAASLRAAYENATAAHEAGDLTAREYARQLAVLAAAADALLADHRALQERAANHSTFDLRAAGYDEAALRDALGGLRPLTGSGAAALLERFTGGREGSVEVETDDGLSIEVESEDGERTREFERPGDDDDAVTVSGSAALTAARAALSSDAGTWALVDSSVDHGDGVYAYEFVLRSGNATGTAEVTVDGSAGVVIGLEEEIEAREDDGRDDEDDDGEDDADGEADEGDDRDEEDDEGDDGEDAEVEELALVLAGGDPGRNATVTVAVLADGAPVENATVRSDDGVLGTTAANGTLVVRLPDREEVELTATYADEDAELSFEFEREDDLVAGLSLTGAYDGDAATLRVVHDGEPVRGVSVAVDGERVGDTDADGRVSFPTDAGEFEVTATKGALAFTATLAVEDGSLVVRDGPELVDPEETGDDAEADDDSEESEGEEADDDDSGETDDDGELEDDDDDDADDESEEADDTDDDGDDD